MRLKNPNCTLTAFMYEMLVEHTNAGALERAVSGIERRPPPYEYSSPILSAWAADLVHRLRSVHPKRYALPATNIFELDPGVCLVVAWLREMGFETCDSGDGETKFERFATIEEGIAEGYRDEPHVTIRVDDPHALIAECDRLIEKLRGVGVACSPQGPAGSKGAFIQAMYDPADRTAFVDVVGLTDEILAMAGVRWPTSGPSFDALMATIPERESSTLGVYVEERNATWDAWSSDALHAPLLPEEVVALSDVALPIAGIIEELVEAKATDPTYGTAPDGTGSGKAFGKACAKCVSVIVAPMLPLGEPERCETCADPDHAVILQDEPEDPDAF